VKQYKRINQQFTNICKKPKEGIRNLMVEETFKQENMRPDKPFTS